MQALKSTNRTPPECSTHVLYRSIAQKLVEAFNHVTSKKDTCILSKSLGGWRTTRVALFLENASSLSPQTFPAFRSTPLTSFGLIEKLVDEMPIAHCGRHWFSSSGSLVFLIQLTNASSDCHKLGTQEMLYTRTVRIHDAKVGGSKF